MSRLAVLDQDHLALRRIDLVLVYEMLGHGLRVAATANAGPAPEVNDLTEQILDAVVDEHKIDPAQRQVVLVKHRQT